MCRKGLASMEGEVDHIPDLLGEIERDLVVGAVRTIVQLYLVGIILASLFAAGRWYWARVLSARPLSDELVGPMGANA